MKNLTFVLGLLYLAGCVSVPYEKTANGLLDTYIGEDYAVAIQQYGPPTQVYSDGADGRILHWETTTATVVPGYSYSSGSGSARADWDRLIWRSSSSSYSTPPMTVYNSHYIQMYVNPDKEIYHYRHNRMSDEEIRAKKTNSTIGQVFGWTAGTGLLIWALTLE